MKFESHKYTVGYDNNNILFVTKFKMYFSIQKIHSPTIINTNHSMVPFKYTETANRDNKTCCKHKAHHKLTEHNREFTDNEIMKG